MRRSLERILCAAPPETFTEKLCGTCELCLLKRRVCTASFKLPTSQDCLKFTAAVTVDWLYKLARLLGCRVCVLTHRLQLWGRSAEHIPASSAEADQNTGVRVGEFVDIPLFYRYGLTCDALTHSTDWLS